MKSERLGWSKISEGKKQEFIKADEVVDPAPTAEEILVNGPAAADARDDYDDLDLADERLGGPYPPTDVLAITDTKAFKDRLKEAGPQMSEGEAWRKRREAREGKKQDKRKAA